MWQRLWQRIRTKRLAAAGLLVMLAVTGLYVFFGQAPELLPTEYEVKSKESQLVGGSEDQALTLANGETEKVVESKPVKSELHFNAIAPHWKESNASEQSRQFAMRVSDDGKEWGDWLEVEAAGPLRDNDPHPDRMFTENPLFVEGKYFQYKVTLNRESAADPSPQIYDLKVSQIDSRKPTRVKVAENIKGFFGPDKAYAAQNHPRIISRSEWGSPDPDGSYFKGTEKYWNFEYYPVSQVVIHHTVTPSYQADTSAAVRAIWDFQSNTRGWGDVGYNYVIDHLGNVYEGRLGGDNVVAGHVGPYNRGSLGVAILGCFDTGSSDCNELNNGNTGPPNAAVQQSLTRLLGHKLNGFEVNPSTYHTFCDRNDQNCLHIPTITGHRDVQQTSCPGAQTVGSLQNIRDNTVAQKNGGWYYSAKQANYPVADLSAAGSADTTLAFKNTGTNSWYRTGLPTYLYTMEPAGRLSKFQGNGWISGSKAALLNEATVAPGQTGTFTVNLKRPTTPIANGLYNEPFTIITADGNTPGAYFALPIRVDCTIGRVSNLRANGGLIRDPNNGRIYLIKEGKKRLINSTLAAYKEGVDPNYAINTSQEELDALPDGTAIDVREGTLIKSADNPNLYVLDRTASNMVKRLITDTAAMQAFGVNASHIHTVSPAVVNAYPAGTTVTAASPIPDGLVIKSAASPNVYVVESGKKRLIPSPLTFLSHGYQSTYIGTVEQAKLDSLANGSNLLIDAGTLVKATDSPNTYAIDFLSNTGYRRLISSPEAFLASGFRPDQINTVTTDVLNNYAAANSVECHK